MFSLQRSGKQKCAKALEQASVIRVREMNRSKTNVVDQQIGERIRRCRLSASLDSGAAAEKCDLSLNDYELSEQGLRRFQSKELFELSRLFKVPFSDILANLTLGP